MAKFEDRVRRYNGGMRLGVLALAVALMAACEPPKPQTGATGGAVAGGTGGAAAEGGPATTTGGSDRYGESAPERQPAYSAGAEKVVANWAIRSAFVEAYGEFHENPASGLLELRTDGTCAGPAIPPLTTPFDGTYRLDRGWIEFSVYPNEHWDYLVNDGMDNGKPALAMTLKNRGVKLTMVRPR